MRGTQVAFVNRIWPIDSASTGGGSTCHSIYSLGPVLPELIFFFKSGYTEFFLYNLSFSSLALSSYQNKIKQNKKLKIQPNKNTYFLWDRQKFLLVKQWFIGQYFITFQNIKLKSNWYVNNNNYLYFFIYRFILKELTTKPFSE